MSCGEIKQKLSAFQDGQLPEDESRIIQDHLSFCESCSSELQELQDVYGLLSHVETIEAAPYFWTKLSRQMKPSTAKKSVWESIVTPAPKFAVPIAATLVFIFALLVGIYLGTNIYNHSAVTASAVTDQELDQVYSLNSFEDFPQESVANAYVSLLTDINHVQGDKNE
jgi:anti-sigma factor RsiW